MVGKMEDRALSQSLSRLRKAAVMNEQDQVVELATCPGTGIMCAVAAAFPGHYLTDQAAMICLQRHSLLTCKAAWRARVNMRTFRLATCKTS